MINAMNTVQCKILDIFEKISGYRLNLQIQKFLMLFREFQETNLDPHIASDLFDSRLVEEFNNLFKFY